MANFFRIDPGKQSANFSHKGSVVTERTSGVGFGCEGILFLKIIFFTIASERRT
jgi:hypothetical protein